MDHTDRSLTTGIQHIKRLLDQGGGMISRSSTGPSGSAPLAVEMQKDVDEEIEWIIVGIPHKYWRTKRDCAEALLTAYTGSEADDDLRRRYHLPTHAERSEEVRKAEAVGMSRTILEELGTPHYPPKE